MNVDFDAMLNEHLNTIANMSRRAAVLAGENAFLVAQSLAKDGRIVELETKVAELAANQKPVAKKK